MPSDSDSDSSSSSSDSDDDIKTKNIKIATRKRRNLEREARSRIEKLEEEKRQQIENEKRQLEKIKIQFQKNKEYKKIEPVIMLAAKIRNDQIQKHTAKNAKMIFSKRKGGKKQSMKKNKRFSNKRSYTLGNVKRSFFNFMQPFSF